MTKSRAEYMKQHRKGKKAFSVLLDEVEFEKIDTYLKKVNLSKKDWLEIQIKDTVEKEK